MDTRKLDELGRIVLPIELRRALDLGDGDGCTMELRDGGILLRKAQPICSLCHGGGDPLRPVAGGYVCPACAELIRR